MYKGETGNTGPTKGENNAVGKDAEPISQAGDFELIKEGETNVVLVAPHGKDETNTALLTKLLASSLNCFAIINNEIDRANVDFNNVESIKEKGYEQAWIEPIDELIENAKKISAKKDCFVFHFHGIEDRRAAKIEGQPDLVLGIGLSGKKTSKENRRTASEEITKKFIACLNKNGITAVIARAGIDSEKRYAAWSKKRLSQYLCYRGGNESDESIHSIQLEIKKAGFRNNIKNVETAATKLADAIRELPDVSKENLPDVKEGHVVHEDTELADKAFEKLKDIFIKHFEAAREKAMLDAGRYIIETFYDGDYDAARDKRAAKKKSLNQLIKKLRSYQGNAPSKTWLYDAVALAVDSHELKSSDEEAFRTFGNLPLSHKLKLTTVKDMDIKKKLIAEMEHKYMPVRAFGKRIKEVSDYKPTLMELIRQPAELFSGNYEALYSKDSLKGLEEKERNKIKAVVENKIDRLQEEISNQQRYVEKYNKLLKSV